MRQENSVVSANACTGTTELPSADNDPLLMTSGLQAVSSRSPGSIYTFAQLHVVSISRAAHIVSYDIHGKYHRALYMVCSSLVSMRLARETSYAVLRYI